MTLRHTHIIKKHRKNHMRSEPWSKKSGYCYFYMILYGFIWFFSWEKPKNQRTRGRSGLRSCTVWKVESQTQTSAMLASHGSMCGYAWGNGDGEKTLPAQPCNHRAGKNHARGMFGFWEINKLKGLWIVKIVQRYSMIFGSSVITYDFMPKHCRFSDVRILVETFEDKSPVGSCFKKSPDVNHYQLNLLPTILMKQSWYPLVI